MAGALNWRGGTIQGVVQCNGGTVSGNCFLDGGQLINTGTMAWDDALLYDGAGSVISNAPGATINLLANGQVTSLYASYEGTATFNNAGQLNVSAGPNGAILADTLINNGIVTVNSGTLNPENGGINNNTIDVATNALLQISGGTFTCTSDSYLNVTNNLLLSGGTVNLAGTVSVGGTNIFSGATVNVTGDYPITSPLFISSGTANLNGTGALTPTILIMSDGTLSNTLPVLINGPLNWSGGQISGVLQCNGGMVTNSGGNLYLFGGQLINNNGTLAWDYAFLFDGAGSVISNALTRRSTSQPTVKLRTLLTPVPLHSTTPASLMSGPGRMGQSSPILS